MDMELSDLENLSFRLTNPNDEVVRVAGAVISNTEDVPGENLLNALALKRAQAKNLELDGVVVEGEFIEDDDEEKEPDWDEDVVRAGLEEKTVEDLRGMLRERDMKVGGNKDELVDRLL